MIRTATCSCDAGHQSAAGSDEFQRCHTGKWEDIVNLEPVTYRLYRAAGTDIPSVEGLAPIIPEIPAEYLATGIVDPHPSPAEPCYVLTAVDTTGNESPPSNSAYHNVGLLPVTDLHVRQQDDASPVISWDHPSKSSIAGYIVDIDGLSMTPELLTERSYSDTGYTFGSDRVYNITAVDVNDVSSQGHDITLPSVQYSVFSEQSSVSRIKRGVMNRLEYALENLSSERVSSARLTVQVESYQHYSDTFSLDAGASTIIPVTIGGYADLPDMSALTTTLAITPNPGETVEIIRTSEIEVGDGMLVAQILNDEFTRGVTGTVRFTLENTGDETIEILTASGSSVSPDIHWELVDEDGNVLSSASFRQQVGPFLVTLANGTTVARIPAGEVFTSDPVEIFVPLNAPDDVTLRLRIATIYAHYGRSEQVTMEGLSTTQPVNLRDTAYYGEVLSISPEQSDGHEPITITARAMDRASEQPFPEVPLTLVISVAGFDRSYDLMTGSDGRLSYPFTPLPGESGRYTVRVVHPALLDRPIHGSFVIRRVSVNPGGFNLNIPRNYEQTVRFTITTGEGTELANLRLMYEAADQPGGVFPQGLHVTLPGIADILSASSAATFPITLWADNTAAESDTLTLKVVSDECAAVAEDGTCQETQPKLWDTVIITTHVSEALPVLSVSPTYLDTGLAHDDAVTETVSFTNTGLAPLEGMRLSLLADTSGTPVPNWVSLLSSPTPGALAVGESHDAAIAFHPDDTVEEGLHQFVLRVTGDNHPTLDIGLYATVTQSGQGQVLFKLSDIYTGTLDETGQPIQGLAGAKIKMQHETVWSIEDTLTTDSFGEALFANLPVGRYRYRITAADHEEAAGWCWVKPGITSTQELFLEYELVTVEWEVKEITLEDTYDIVLNTTYKTDVPAAVVVADPASVRLPVMQPGDVFQGEITLTNHGLIQAEQVVFALPADDQYVDYELLTDVPDIIGAGASVTIPYRITSVQAFSGGDDGNASGGGSCGEYTSCSTMVYVYVCVNGQWVLKEQQATCFTSVPPQCVPSGLGPTFWESSLRKRSQQQQIEKIKLDFAQQHGGSGSGSILVTERPPNEMEGTVCLPEGPNTRDPEERQPHTDDRRSNCWPEPLPIPMPGSGASVCLLKDTEQDRHVCTFSSVDLVLREYQRDDPDLLVSTPQGGLPLRRLFKGNHWYLGPANFPLTTPEGPAQMPQPSLTFNNTSDDGDGVIYQIIKDGTLVYALPDGSYAKSVILRPDGTTEEHYFLIGSPVYLNGSAKIRRIELSATETHWLWSTESGYWKLYDDQGHFLEFGTGSWYGQQGRRWYYALYDETTGRLNGYADDDGQQLIWIEYDSSGLLNAAHDGQDQRVEYGYEDGRLTTVTDVTAAATTTFGYDELGRMSSVGTPDGFDGTIRYDGDTNRVWLLEDADGQIMTFAYGYDKRKEEYYAGVTYPSGELKEVWFDTEGDTTRVDVDGVTITRIEKDEENNALIITDQYDQQTRKEYDEWDNLKTVIHPDGSETRYDYDLPKHRLLRQDDRGLVTEYTYTEHDMLAKLVEAKGEDQERITEYEYTAEGTRSFMRLTENANSAFRTVTEETYNADGNRSQLKDAVGSEFERITDYAYDAEGNLSTITKHLADGQTAVTEMQYDAEGNLSWKRGPDGQEVSYSYVEGQLESMTTISGTWAYAYDDEGRMTTVSDPFGNTRGREYDEEGNVTVVTVNGQIVGTYSYAGEGVLRERTDAAGNVYRFGHNEDGQLTWQQDPENRLLWYEYDEQGRLWKTTDGSGNAIIREYGVVSDGSSSSCTSCSGGLFSRSDEGVERLQKIIYPTFTKEFRYDTEGRVSEEIYVLDGGGTYSVSYSYDQFGRLQSTTGPDGKTTTTHYDLLGRKIMVTGDTGHVEFEYDNWDNLISLSDAKGQVTEFVYDSSGRLTQEIRPMNQSTGYEYDDSGRLQNILDAKNQRTEYGYDSQGRIETISYDDGRSVTLSYDADGNLAGYDDGVTSASYTYDALGRKLSETVNYGAFSKTLSYTYYNNGLKKSFTAPDGTTYEYAYGSNNELREVKIPGLGSITISEYQWNRPATMRYPGGSTREYEYDALMRLTRLVAKDPGGNALLDYSYDYDSPGNIVSKTTEHGPYSYGYDSASRLTSVENPTLDDESYSYDAVGNRVTASNAIGTISHNANNELLVYGDVEYVYDANGNMIQKKLGDVAVNYIYNAENRLIRVEDELTDLVIAEYYYDPFGRRLWKEISGTHTYFFYSDEGLVAEYTASGMELKSYGYKPDSTWTTDPLWLKHGNEYYFYQNDHLGTPQKLVAQNGLVVWSAKYNSFGEAQVEVGTVVNNLRFPGQYFDAEAGLHYNWHRYYDPKIGRYVQNDLMGFEAGDVNLYSYTGNNPIKSGDPLGLWAVSREGGRQAEALSDCDDTVEELANMIGFDAKDYQQWLTPASVGSFPVTVTQKIGNRKFYIPNTVYAYWAGHLSWFGRWHVSWNVSISYLRKLGFLVVEDRHVQGMGAYLESEVLRLANAKALHGLYFWGHGSRNYGLHVAQKNMFGLIKQSSWEVVLLYTSIRRDLPYKMALGLMFACFSNTGKTDLFSNAPGGIWHDYDKILYPISGNYHVHHWIQPGDQETHVFKLPDES